MTDYYQKYLKYKNKYLELKYGGAPALLAGRMVARNALKHGKTLYKKHGHKIKNMARDHWEENKDEIKKKVKEHSNKIVKYGKDEIKKIKKIKKIKEILTKGESTDLKEPAIQLMKKILKTVGIENIDSLVLFLKDNKDVITPIQEDTFNLLQKNLNKMFDIITDTQIKELKDIFLKSDDSKQNDDLTDKGTEDKSS
jgi:hypothetical protein